MSQGTQDGAKLVRTVPAGGQGSMDLQWADPDELDEYFNVVYDNPDSPDTLDALQPGHQPELVLQMQRDRASRRSRNKDGQLGKKASRGAAVTMGGQLARLVVQTIGVFLLARLLTPKDYGLTTMVTAIIGIGETLRDFGLSLAAVQGREMSNRVRDNLFWLNTIIGAGLTAIVFGCSGLIAHLYGDDRLTRVAMFLAFTFLFNGASAQYRTYLQRHLRFIALSVVDIGGLIAGIAVGIGMAVAGYGYWAIVGQQLTLSVVSLLIAVGASRWLPRGYHRHTSVRSYLKFGLDVLLAQVISYFCKNTDSVTIGIRYGAGPLGLYNRAFQLLTLPLAQIQAPSTRVAYPVLARLKDDKERYDAYLLTGQTVLLHVILFVMAIMGGLAEPLVSLVLGPHWIGSASLFQILAIAGWFQAAGYVTFWVFMSKGLSRTSLKQTLVTRPITIATVIIGSYWGVEGVAWGYAAGTALNWPVSLWWIKRVSDAPVGKILYNGVRGVVSYGTAAVAAYFTARALEQDADIVRVAAGFGAILAVLAVTYAVWPRYRRDVGLLTAAVRKLR